MVNNDGRFSGLVVKESLWPRNSWKLGRVIGSGACSEIYEATCQLTSKSNGRKNLSSDKATSFVAKVSPLPEQKVVASKKQRKKYPEKASADVLHMEHSFYRNCLAGHPRVPRMPTDGGYGDDLTIGVRFMVSYNHCVSSLLARAKIPPGNTMRLPIPIFFAFCNHLLHTLL